MNDKKISERYLKQTYGFFVISYDDKNRGVSTGNTCDQ